MGSLLTGRASLTNEFLSPPISTRSTVFCVQRPKLGTSDEVKGRSGFRSWFRILKSFYAKRTGRGGRGLEVCRLRPVGHAFGLRAAAAWPRVSVSGRSSAGPADVAVTGYGKICVS